MDLNKRIADLERRAPPAKREQPTIQSMELSWERFEASQAAREAERARRLTLPLEEQLTLEKADLEERRRDTRPTLGRDLYESVVAAFGVRRVEIAIFERDGLIDAEMASKLHDNAWAHVRFNAPLTPLPGAIIEG